MARIKKLKIETIFADSAPYPDIKEEVIDGYYGPIIPPIFKKPGVYKRGKECWVELDETFAFMYKDDGMFDFYLKNLTFDEKPLRDFEFKAIDVLLRFNPKLVTSIMYSLHYNYKKNKESLQKRKDINIWLKDILTD